MLMNAAKPPLTRAQINDLILKAQAGDRRARERVICHNLGFINRTAQRFVGQGTEFEDLIQCGAIGLDRAINDFDPGRGFNFLTYAAAWVKQTMLRQIQKEGRFKFSTNWERVLLFQLPRLEARLRAEHGTIDDEMVVTALNAGGGRLKGRKYSWAKHLSPDPLHYTVEQVQLFRAKHRALTLSLDQPINEFDEGGHTLGDLLPDLKPRAEELLTAHEAQQRLATRVERIMKCFDTRDRFIIRKYFLADPRWTYDAIGKVHGISRERIRQLIQQIKPKLQRLLKEFDDGTHEGFGGVGAGAGGVRRGDRDHLEDGAVRDRQLSPAEPREERGRAAARVG